MIRKIVLTVAVVALALTSTRAENSVSFRCAKPVWPQGQSTNMNDSVLFESFFELNEGTGPKFEGPVPSLKGPVPSLKITAASVYRVWLNGEFLGYGPARGAIGYFRVDEWPMPKAKMGRNKLVIEVSAYNCRNFYIPRWPGFLQAEVVAGDFVIAATPEKFKAYDTGRVRVVSRYSFQRGFSEAYRLPHEPRELPLEVRGDVRLLERIASYPEFRVIREYRPVARTKVKWQADLEYRKNRFIDGVDNVKIDGFAKDELEFNGWEAVWKWKVCDASFPGNATTERVRTGEGVVYDAHVDRCGFFGFHVSAKKPTRIVALFDEMAENGKVDATRTYAANAVQWQLAPGEYDLETFEPYMAAGLHLVVAEGEAEIGAPFLREYASPDATAECPTDDPQLKAIFEAARESFRANAVDVFTDCPGRERAGWLCDSFFTARSALLFTGSTKLERLFLQNYLLPESFDYIPKGALPMCYPSDHADGVFIPNWNFWLVLELEEYLHRSGDRATIDAFRPKMMELVSFMRKYENADGLLERLPSWVFVEWSKANELVRDVSYPSNATWASVLESLARLYDLSDLAAKAKGVRETIRRQSWNGEWFVDNAIRQGDGTLRRGEIATEVAQYYMFLFGVASAKSHPQLWRRLVSEFGPDRAKRGLYPEVPSAAEFIGNYLRLEMLSKAGFGDQVLREMGGYFRKMADQTGTLWELSGRSSSKNHGFASYAACWIAKHAPRCAAKVSPDGKNRIEYRDGKITVSREGRILLGPQPVALELDRGEAKVELVARDDGVAYRFVTDEDGEITVSNEVCSLVFDGGRDATSPSLWVGYNWCDNPNDPKQDKLQHGCASVYTETTPSAFVPDGRRIAYLPMTIRHADGTTVLFSESDLRDYAGLHLRRDGASSNRLDAVFGKFPIREKEYVAPRNYRRVKEREDWIVRTSGRRTFPWRVFAIAPSPIKIAEQRLVRDLAAPAEGDFSWVRPGLATWEWWNKWHLENVPFEPGVNTATYKAYVDFAAEYKLDWLLVDEGWKRGDDFSAIVPEFDLDEIVGYAAKRNVQVMLWTAWRALDGRQDEVFSAFAKRGVNGFKIDFMERDDAEVVRFMEETLKAAAKHRLCIDYHGCGKPTGLEKTYPNLIGVEGVHGLELMKLGFAKGDDFPAHDCQIVYTRAPLGMVDYTPGAMMNRRREDWKPDDANPASQGTRVHQLALYTLFPVPFQTLCDSPSRYRKNPECTRFLAAMPTTWDETKGLCGEIGKFAAVARRKAGEWWVGAITDWTARELEIDTSFLAQGDWVAEVFADDDAARNPENWRREVLVVRSGEKLKASLAPGGGWTARLSPAKSCCVFLEAEAFDDVGGWTVDAQHRLQMGSPYLLAHGLGKPVADAKMKFASEEGGVHRLWVRTRNWTAPWSKEAAGRFRVKVNGAVIGGEFGTGSEEWRWCGGAECELKRGTNEIAIADLTGFDGRVDAIALIPSAGAFPRNAQEERTHRTVSADLVVAGGGVAGTCAAIAAARSGLKVALVQDRPVLGGNNSSEVRVHMGGHLQCGRYPHLGDIVAEMSPDEGGNAREAAAYEDDRKLRLVRSETNIVLFLNTKVVGVETNCGEIVAAIGEDVRSGHRVSFAAPLFVDATGDGTLGALAGADFRVGRESRAETGEAGAPERADSLTMGASCQWRAVKRGEPIGFAQQSWMLPFNGRNATVAMRGDWDWETGLGRDQVAEAERIRDYGMLVAYSNWAFVKNRSSRRDEFAKSELEWVASVSGKRESRRLLGDVILDENDLRTPRHYPDGTCLTSWSVDLHYPKTAAETHFDGESFRTRCDQRRIALYPIPYGCLYSRNVGNLFMAGRNISVTHVALGTVRVMRTTGMMGEVVGMAAAVCREKGCRPRDVRNRHFDALAARMARGAGRGNVHSRQEYNTHPSLGLDPNDAEAVSRSRARGWLNVDHFRGLTANEPGRITNGFVTVVGDERGASAYRRGEKSPFAAWNWKSADGVERVRLDGERPFVYVDVAPRAHATNRLAGVIAYPTLKLDGIASGAVRMGSAGLGGIDDAEPTCGYLALAEPRTRRGVVAAWLTNFRGCGAFETRREADGSVAVTPIADYGRMLVKVGRDQPFDTFVIGAFDDCRIGLESYADAVAARFDIRLPPNPAGYCTWCSDRYGASDRSLFAKGCGAGTEESTIACAELAAKTIGPYGFSFIQIDDQWQAGGVRNGPAKDWSKTDPKGGYPNGFGRVVTSLNRLGLAAGLWFIPFGADAKADCWKGCEDLYVKSAVEIPRKIGKDAYREVVVAPRNAGDPIRTVWGGECLDMTNPGARARLAETVRRFTHDWGFRYLKCDGVFTGFGCDLYGGYGWRDVNFSNAVFSDPEASNVSAYREGFGTIREAAAPGTFVLGCNLGTIRAMVPSFGLVDGMRIGNDNGPIGQNPMQYLEGPRAGTMRYFLNGRVWWNDPDSTYVRSALPIGRARLGASWAAVSGSLFEVGDWLGDLPKERVEILRRALANRSAWKARPIDYFESELPNAWILDRGEEKVVAIFNWSTNETLKVDYDFAYAGLDPKQTYAGRDFWADRPTPPFRDRLRATVPPDDCLILELRRESARGDRPLKHPDFTGVRRASERFGKD